MKPRTKLQHQVVELAKYLPNIDNRILSWAKVDCLEHRGYTTKSRVICMDCGGRFSPELVNRKRAVCPHCKTKIKVEQSRKRTDEQRVYVSSAEIFDEFQVIRNFEICAYYRADETPRYYIDEILQHWVLPNGKYESYGRNHTTNWYCDSWNGDMEIRKNYSRYYQSSNTYDVYPYKYHPASRFKPEYNLYGIDYKLSGLTFLESIKLLPKDSRAETLFKVKQYGLLSYLREYSGRISHRWASIKICLRNKYVVKDASIWFDYLDLLDYFRKDLHNAYYVCPKNLKREHDRLVARKRKIQAKQEAERKRKKALEDEKIFHELKSKFFGIAFSDKDIQVQVLESIQEHMDEGDVLKHCVFTNEYYIKPDSLILSAMVNGVKTETIEISIEKMKVVQCRGKQNENTEYHDQIIKLVNKNMNLIRERIKPKRKRSAQQSVSQFNQVAV